MSNHLISACQHFIGGEYSPSQSGKTFANIASCDGSELGSVAAGDKADIERAVAAASTALSNSGWQQRSFKERAATLNKVAELLDTHRERFAKMEAIDTGKPYSETVNGDIPRAAANFRFFAQHCTEQTPKEWLSEDGSTHRSYREPIGIVGLITPWNLPLYLATWKIAPALAMGNAVILKPAELTPMTATALGDLMNEAGVPPGIFNVVHGMGPNAAGEALVCHPAVKAISFTGETLTGSAIMKAAAPHLKKLSFELGGKGASVVFADADLDAAARTAARAAFRNQGQICLAGSRLIVEECAATAVVAKIAKEADKIKLGHPLDEATTMGALICHDHRDKVAGFVEAARNNGGRIVCGGYIPEGLSNGAYYAPTIIDQLGNDAAICREEVFGPVLTVQTFKTRDEATALLNSTDYGLSCSIWSSNQGTLDWVSANAKMGLVWQNTWFLRNLNTAFGGMKRSGIGREGGDFSLDFYSEYKTISAPARQN